MKIGVDLDNTIIDYRNVFGPIGVKYGWLPELYRFKTKIEIKQYLFSQAHLGEEVWMKIQGQAYGQEVNNACLMKGVKKAFKTLLQNHASIFIVSHKSKFGHFDKTKTNLRSAALAFLLRNNLFTINKNFGIKNVSFHSTLDGKVRAINGLDLDFFIDDLDKVLLHPMFPAKVKKIHFKDRDVATEPAFDLTSFSWSEISRFISEWQETENVR